VAVAGPTIHIVDDDDAVRESLQALLESYGFVVNAYSAGAAFLAHCPPDLPGCLVLDMQLPNLGGLEILGRIRADARNDMPVLVLTGHGDKAMKERALAAGAANYLEKPIDCDVLVATIRALISTADSRGRMGSAPNPPG